jgi:hypothetical protein
MDDRGRARWAEILRHQQTEYLILDPLRPILDAYGLDEHRDAGRFLVAFDALLDEAGVPDGMIVHHMGHTAERARGDSRLRDWPDVEWRLVRSTDDPGSPRYVTAFGRDVDVPEGGLKFDPATRHLRLTSGSRKDAEARDVIPDLLEYLRGADGPQSGNQVEIGLRAVSTHGQKAIRRALVLALHEQLVDATPGHRNATLYTVKTP